MSLFGDAASDGLYMHTVLTMGEGDYDDKGNWNPVAVADAGFDELAALSCVDKKGVREDSPGCNGGGGGGPPGEVPVPGTAFLLGLGLLGVYRGRRRQLKA